MEERLKEEEEICRDISIASDCMKPKKKKKKKKEKKEMTEAKKKYLQRRREYDQKKSDLYFIKKHEKRMQKRLFKQQKQDQQQSFPYPPPQIETIPSGNLPPGFDSSTSRSEFGQRSNVSWAYASGQSQREDISAHFNIFVSDLSPEVTDATLYACFSVYPSCSDAKVMRDQKTGCSRGFGFVSIRNQQEAQSAINHLTGKWLGSRYIRCNWVAKGATSNDEKQVSDVKNVVELTYGGTSVDGQVTINADAPENNPQYTTVNVGNLAPEISLLDLHRHFHFLGAGVIEEVRVQREKGLGFVRYSNHSEAALAIQMGNARMFFGKPLRCSWGSKPAPPGTSSTPLPPPAAATAGPFPGITPYERQMQMSKMGGAQAAPMMHHHPHPRPALNQAMGMGAAGAASQAIYDYGYQNTQQQMYYHR